MGYRKEIYQKAFEIKKNAIKLATEQYEKKINELKEANSEFCDIELSLSQLGPAIAMAAIQADEEKFVALKKTTDKLNARKAELLSEAKIVKPDCFCKQCRDTGYFGSGPCSCITDIARSLVAEELSRTMPVGNCSFESFDLAYYSDKEDDKGRVPRRRAENILSAAKKFVDDFPNAKSLLFMGETGLGKTHISLSIVSAVCDKGYSVVYGPAGTLFSAAEKEHFSYSGETEKLDSLLSCDLLVIDDLGTEFLSAFTSSLFYNIINSRLLANKPTVISTNLDIDEIEKRYSNRIASRFIGNYEVKRFLGEDIRQQKAYK